MLTIEIFHTVLILAAFLCSLVAGFLFAFAIVVMPGIKRLNDREFIRAFQVMDQIIQNNQPMFILAWAGSVVSVVAAAVLGFGQLDHGKGIIFSAAAAYLLGVQLPTFKVNIPLNNRLQALDVGAMDESGEKAARAGFESLWNRWNTIRTVFACLSSVLLIVLLFKL